MSESELWEELTKLGKRLGRLEKEMGNHYHIVPVATNKKDVYGQIKSGLPKESVNE